MLMVESTVVLAIATMACYVSQSAIYRALRGRLPLHHWMLYAFSPGEASMNGIRIAVLGGLLLSIPVLGYLVCVHLLRTTGPLDPMLLAVPLLCVLGVVAGWLIVLPTRLGEFTGYQSDTIHYLPRARDYIDFSLTTLIVPSAVLGGVGALALRRAG